MLTQTKVVNAMTESRRSCEETWIETCLAVSVEVAPFLDGIEEQMTYWGYTPRTCRELRLVLEEAIVNGLKHGNGGDPSKQVRVRYHIGPDGVAADVEDEGPGFDPSTVPDPTLPENLDRSCGRGLLLMRSYTTWMRYSPRGNCVTLYKRRPD